MKRKTRKGMNNGQGVRPQMGRQCKGDPEGGEAVRWGEDGGGRRGRRWGGGLGWI